MSVDSTDSIFRSRLVKSDSFVHLRLDPELRSHRWRPFRLPLQSDSTLPDPHGGAAPGGPRPHRGAAPGGPRGSKLRVRVRPCPSAASISRIPVSPLRPRVGVPGPHGALARPGPPGLLRGAVSPRHERPGALHLPHGALGTRLAP